MSVDLKPAEPHKKCFDMASKWWVFVHATLQLMRSTTACAPEEHIVVEPSPSIDKLVAADQARLLHPGEFKTNITRRWYSLPLDESDKDVYRGLWPGLPVTDQQGKRTVDESKHYIRYCFVDDESANNLLDIWVHAIARWKPAAQVSSFDIIPETQCDAGKPEDQYRCICNKDSGDTLQIRDGRENKGVKRTTVGFQHGTSQPGRNHMIFDYSAKSEAMPRQQGITGMSHEVGHSIGLLHEHQRPDRRYFVTYRCENLAGHAQAKQDAAANKRGGFDPAQTIEDRMKSICERPAIAMKYFRKATQYMSPVPSVQGEYAKKELFDFGSMMIYGSAKNGEGPEPRPYKAWPMSREPATDQRPFYTGGSADNEKAVPSVQDVLRVAALYPTKHPEKRQRLQHLEEEQKWEPLEVKIEGLITTTVVSLPTDIAQEAPKKGEVGGGHGWVV